MTNKPIGLGSTSLYVIYRICVFKCTLGHKNKQTTNKQTTIIRFSKISYSEQLKCRCRNKCTKFRCIKIKLQCAAHCTSTCIPGLDPPREKCPYIKMCNRQIILIVLMTDHRSVTERSCKCYQQNMYK